MKYAGNNIFINEQLTPGSQRIFNSCKCKKNWKFLWTKNGVVYLRKDEQSNVIKCIDGIDRECNHVNFTGMLANNLFLLQT